ncbi:MAG: helix-turn-helix domain-containing protein, partial [Planctomycetes bacterium]|nr:helix-turn-helix domain-containing protein [Planctomycetota bacterium]
MANQLKMGLVNSIRTLLTRGWSQRRIARELGVNRETVGRYAKSGRHDEVFVEAAADSADPKPAKAPTGSSGDGSGEPPCARDGAK